VILIGADEKAGCKAVEAAFLGLLRCLEQAKLVTLAAAVFDILCHGTDEGPQGIVIFLDQTQIDGFGVFPQAISSGPVLRKGVDIGVEPKAGDLNFIGTQHLNALIGAGGAADMEQCFHKNLQNKLTELYHGNFKISRHPKICHCEDALASVAISS
jgi:hypothetical protein